MLDWDCALDLVNFYFSLQVPEGFEMCVRLMLPGEIALVTCPPDYAYDKFSRWFFLFIYLFSLNIII